MTRRCTTQPAYAREAWRHGVGCLLAVFALAAAPGSAQLADPSGQWRTLHTAHFRVHFRPAYRAAALEAAREAERAYTLLRGELHPPRGVVDLTLADDADVANGFATVFPTNRITVFLTPPTTDAALQHFDSWLRLVIVHELAHLFHLDRTRGFWRALQAVFGRAPGLFPNAYQPSWVTEGLATYYESRFTTAGRVDGSLHRQLIGADLAAGAARSPWDALAFTRWPDGFTPYAYGATFLAHAARARGDSVLPRFVEATSKQLIPFRVGRQLRRAGATERIGAAWTEALRAGAAPPARAAPAPAPAEEVLVSRLWSDPAPATSPDGSRLAYLRNDGKGAGRLVIADAATLEPRRSRRVNGGVRFDWLGDTLLVAQLDFTARWRLRSDLYRWEPTGNWRRVTRGARITEPQAGGGTSAWLVLEPGGNRPNLPTPAAAPGVAWGPVEPSPDGRRVAAARHTEGRWSLVAWPLAAPESLDVLLESGHVVADPLWAPDGSLLFVWDVSGLPQVYRWDPTGPVALTAAPHGARSPAALPDGTVIYSTFREGGWALARSRLVSRAAVVPRSGPPLAEAPPVEARETGYSALPSLWPRYWLPVLSDADRAGFFVGAATFGTDALERWAYGAQALYSWNPSRLMGAVALANRSLGNPTFDASGSMDWSFSGITAGGREVSLLETDAALGLTFERRRWRTTASVRLAGEYEGLRLALVPDSAAPHLDLVGGSATLALAHYVLAPLAVSPQDGFAWSVTYRRREAQGSELWSDEYRTRLAVYLPFPGLGTFGHAVLALRGAAGMAQGPIGERFEVGGDAGGGLDYLAVQVVGGAEPFFVRGYPEGERRGTRAVAASAELRLPLLLVGRSLGHLPVGADMLSLAFFADAGDAWNARARGRFARLRSAGAELVADLTVSYDAHLRLRLGLARPLEARDARAYLVFGSAF
ncbi:MAG TPA: hypothetical protein VNI61_05655 [Gemmatimonadales bacterium]|nr:hypothetical protein [Gemmatimonadales bacterium]